MPESPTLSPSSRKGKERQAPQPTNIVDRVIALQRKQARTEMNKPKERPDRPDRPAATTATLRSNAARAPSPRRMHAPPLPGPNIVVSQPVADPHPDDQDFSRRLKISQSPRASHSKVQASTSKHLYNPNMDTMRRPVITAEPETMSDGGSSSYAPRAAVNSSRHHGSPSTRGEPGQRLFDHRKDNPHKFGAQARPAQPSVPSGSSPNLNGRPTPTPKSSGDYISASSTSSASYAQSTISSNFTFSSTTTDSSQSSAIFDSSQRRSEDSAGPVNALSVKLKSLYRTISALEDKVAKGDVEDEVDRDGHSRVLMKGRLLNGSPSQGVKKVGDEEAERERWRKLIADHKELADHMHHMLTLTSAPTVPSSLRSVPQKYNLIIRLWTHAFHRMLENLRRAALGSVIALEHLQDFIYYAYAFYGYLLEERNLFSFRAGWLEALGDLARYRILVSKMVEGNAPPGSSLTASAVARVQTLSAAHLTPRPSTPVGGETSALSGKAASPTPAARIDDSPPPSRAPHVNPYHYHNAPSVGVVAAQLMELEPEPERWRQIAKLWYAKGLTMMPGVGKLHHHLGLLSREKEGNDEELRGVYHFIKGMTCLHPFTNSRESILPLWSANAQARRGAPDARSSELFILLHGMLFTNIQLDDFKPVLARFEEKLLIDGVDSIQDREWIMMAIINLGSILEYGRPNAVLRQVSGIENRTGQPITNPAMAAKVKLMVAKRLDGDDKKMVVDSEGDADAPAERAGPNGSSLSPVMSDLTPTATEAPGVPTQLKLAIQLTFAMLSHTFRKPTRQTTPFASHMLNPYITIIFTFLATILKDRHSLSVLERAIPWEEFVAFLNGTLSRRLLTREQEKERSDGGMLLTSGSTPLSEDWCLRGLGWGGKKVYERGFWGKDSTGEEENVEMEVLDKDESEEEMMDGIIADEDGDDKKQQPGRQEMHARMVRVARSALKIAKVVPGFVYVPTPDGRGEWKVQDPLADKVSRWREEDKKEKEDEERRMLGRGTKWDDDSMEVDDDGEENLYGEDGDESEDGDQESDEVQALKARRQYLQNLLQSSPVSASSRRRPRGSVPRKIGPSRSALHVIPGYTILVVDTNILLSSLAIFSSLVESLRWTIVIPLPVIMELDGLATNDSPLGQAAAAATAYIVSHLRTHAKSLKVQTSKGNYLANLSVRTEQVEWNNEEASWERNVDDLILRAAVWQTEHWVDRSSFLGSGDKAETTGASKVTLLSFDRMLRLKARSREVDAANEQDLAAILASVS